MNKFLLANTLKTKDAPEAPEEAISEERKEKVKAFNMEDGKKETDEEIKEQDFSDDKSSKDDLLMIEYFPMYKDDTKQSVKDELQDLEEYVEKKMMFCTSCRNCMNISKSVICV